jgi:hypothetical protein
VFHRSSAVMRSMARVHFSGPSAAAHVRAAKTEREGPIGSNRRHRTRNGIFGPDRSHVVRHSLICELPPFVVNFVIVQWRRNLGVLRKAKTWRRVDANPSRMRSGRAGFSPTGARSASPKRKQLARDGSAVTMAAVLGRSYRFPILTKTEHGALTCRFPETGFRS